MVAAAHKFEASALSKGGVCVCLGSVGLRREHWPVRSGSASADAMVQDKQIPCSGMDWSKSSEQAIQHESFTMVLIGDGAHVTSAL